MFTEAERKGATLSAALAALRVGMRPELSQLPAAIPVRYPVSPISPTFIGMPPMNRRSIWLALSAVVFSLAVVSQAWADPAPKFPPYAQVIGEAQTIPGLITLHRKDMRLLAEISQADLNKDFIVAIAIARGIGQTPLLGGMTVHFDDTWVWQFRKAEDRIQIVRRNVRFRANSGSPQEKAVYLSYTDSILFSLPIATMSPTGNFVVDLTPVFMSDLPQFSHIFPGFGFAPDRSTWAKIKGFPTNVEIEVAATYASSGMATIDTVPDTRAATLYVHYSISRLPETGYQPRLADDRVGYFLTVIKDFSKVGQNDQFVRYINRWDLRKAEPSAEVSPPATPIIVWIEKTVPFKYRGAVRDGILEWNKAFERAGFSNAIEVRQQPDDATWDPEDIRYNTFRWITANAGFAMGPARTNPLTGQILDADIIFDADFIEVWTKQLELEKSDAGFDLFGAAVDAAKPRDGSTRAAVRPGVRARDRYRRAGAAVRLWRDGLGHRRQARHESANRKAVGRGGEIRRHARSRTHARSAAQLQGQLAADDGRNQRSGKESNHRPGRLGDGLHPGEHLAEGQEAGRLLHAKHRSLRLLGD